MRSRRRQPSARSRGATALAFGALFVGGLASSVCGGTSPKKPNGSDDGKATPQPADPPRAEFDLFAFGRVLGTIAPCGCTTEPLGGLQFAFGYLDAHSEAGSRLVVEPGSFLFPPPGGSEWPTDDAGWEQAEDRASLLQTRFVALGDALVSGLGPTDLASPRGLAALATHPLPRVAANLEVPEDVPALPGHRLIALTSHGVTWTVGVTAAIDPSVWPTVPGSGSVKPAVPALQEQVAAMRKAGATFTVVLAQGARPFAESLATNVEGLDAVVVGQVEGVDRERLGTPVARIGDTFVLEPGEKLQTVTRLRLSVDPGAPAVPSVQEWTVVPPRSALEDELARAEARIAKFSADASADPTFIARLESERDRLRASLEQEASPDAKAVAVFDQVKITCKLPVDDAAKRQLGAYDQAVAQANKRRFAGVKPPAPAKRRAGFVGTEECEGCHDEAIEFWKTTVHADAYETLVVDNKQFDLNCVGCHVTGFRQPGGSEVVENEGLRDVQCEVCHGPASKHIDDGGDDLSRIELEAPAELCALECHTPEHSDTFDYVPYLRDVLGPGHGEEARKKLGEGPTGRELRKAGLAKAGGACKKM